jgi:hypothetical protein
MHRGVVGRAQQRPRGAARGIIRALAAAVCAGLGIAKYRWLLFTQACAELAAAFPLAAVQGLP